MRRQGPNIRFLQPPSHPLSKAEQDLLMIDLLFIPDVAAASAAQMIENLRLLDSRTPIAGEVTAAKLSNIATVIAKLPISPPSAASAWPAQAPDFALSSNTFAHLRNAVVNMQGYAEGIPCEAKQRKKLLRLVAANAWHHIHRMLIGNIKSTETGLFIMTCNTRKWRVTGKPCRTRQLDTNLTSHLNRLQNMYEKTTPGITELSDSVFETLISLLELSKKPIPKHSRHYETFIAAIIENISNLYCPINADIRFDNKVQDKIHQRELLLPTSHLVGDHTALDLLRFSLHPGMHQAQLRQAKTALDSRAHKYSTSEFEKGVREAFD